MVHDSAKSSGQTSLNGSVSSNEQFDPMAGLLHPGSRQSTHYGCAAKEQGIAEKLRNVSEAVRFIHTLESPAAMMQAIADQARLIIGSHLAIASFAMGPHGSKATHAISLSQAHGARRELRVRLERAHTYRQVCETNRSVRLDQQTLHAHSDWRKISHFVGSQLPTSGLIAAPFVGQDGRNTGLILLAEKSSGEFSEGDEVLLAQLAYMTATAIENARLLKVARDANTRLENILSSITDAFFAIDHDWRFTYMNRAAERLLQRPGHEIIGRRVWDAIPGTRSLHPFTKYQEALAKQQTIKFQEYFPPLGIWMDLRAYPTRDGLAVYARDVSEQRETESELRALNRKLEKRVRERTAELEAANRELTAFSYSVSHDLRAPLRTIHGFAQALIEDCGDQLDEAGVDYLQRIQNASRRMGDLINDLLYLSRVTRTDLVRQKADLSAMAREALAMLQEDNSERDVSFFVQPNLFAYCDPGLLRVVLENLLANAWKFTAGVSDARIVLGMEQQGMRGPVFFVRDNGIGFDMAFADRLFQPFERLHPEEAYRGNGIGLATVSRIVQRHGGRLWVEAAVGQGATFYFTVA